MYKPFQRRILNRYKIKPFQPDFYLLRVWDMFVLYTYIQEVCFIPMNLSFDLNVTRSHYPLGYWILNGYPIYCYIIDFFIKINTSYYQKSCLIENRMMIFKHYLSKEIVLDIITIVPILISS